MMHMAVGRLEVTVSLAERVKDRLLECQTAAQRAVARHAYNQGRLWKTVEGERAAWGAQSLMLRAGTLR